MLVGVGGAGGRVEAAPGAGATGPRPRVARLPVGGTTTPAPGVAAVPEGVARRAKAATPGAGVASRLHDFIRLLPCVLVLGTCSLNSGVADSDCIG